jgi:multiple sugar transport system ATP-binding protein
MYSKKKEIVVATVVLKDVNKVYPNGFQAVYNADVEIEDREFVILVGPSGCGKSTTLRMIAGLEEISTGDLLIDDALMNDVHPKERDIAMVFQNYALYPHMSVYENMAFGLKMRQTPKDEIDNRVKEAANILHIEDLLDRKPKQLSGGQRQRVALGRAIVRKPKVFLFDEPLSNLDAKLRVTMRAEISRLHSKLKATMVYVTHDQVEAMTMGSRIVVMKDGYVQQIDTPMNLYKNPINKFVAGFIGSPPMNFATLTVKEQGGTISCENEDLKIEPTKKQQTALKEYVGKDVFLGIRPEDLIVDGKEKNKIKVVIDVVEPLGSETVLRVTDEVGHEYIVTAGADREYAEETKVVMGINIDNCHFFDSEEKKYPNGKTENSVIV